MGFSGEEKECVKFDNYDIINIDRVKDIPDDYYGLMGVPVTYLLNHNPEQFKIIKMANGRTDTPDFMELLRINGKKKFNRVIIQHEYKC